MVKKVQINKSERQKLSQAEIKQLTDAMDEAVNKCEFDIIKITPETAIEWLKLNTDNFRPLSPDTIRDYANAILNGRWTIPESAITFGLDGVLSNGQNRLHAIVESGVPTWSMVIWNYPDNPEMDTHKKRKLADNLRRIGVSDVNSVAAAVRILWKFRSGRLHTIGSTDTGITYGEYVELFKQNPGIESAVRKAAKCSSLLSRAFLGFLYYIIKDDNIVLADEFIEKLATGAELQENHPILKLREALNKNSNKEGFDRKEIKYLAAITIRAWNYYIDSRECKHLRWRSIQEPFPKIICSEELVD